MKLTLKQKRFADEYIISGNIYDAAVKAGYSTKYSKARSHELLENVGIKSYIDEKLKEIEASKYLSIDEALKITASIARGEPREIEVYDEELGTWSKRKVYPGFKESNSALDHFYKINGKYIDKKDVNLNGKLDNQVIIKITGDEEDADWVAHW